MSTVDDAVEAGARATVGSWSWPVVTYEMASGARREARTVLRAMWPILTAELRELHKAEWDCGNPRHTNPDVGCPECCEGCVPCGVIWPCPTMQAIQKIDKELGNG